MIRGINYGNNFNYTVTYPQSQIDRDFQYLKNYITDIRIALPGFTSTVGVANAKKAHLDALKYGIKPYGGVTFASYNGKLTLDRWHKEYVPSVHSWVEWAKQNNIQRIEMANELRFVIDNTTITLDVLIQLYKDLCVDIKKYYNGIVSLACEGSEMQRWQQLGLGPIDEIHLNHYAANQNDTGGFRGFLKAAHDVFKDKLILSEWGIDYDWSRVTLTPVEQAQELTERLQIIKDIDVSEHYGFTYRTAQGSFAFRLPDEKFRIMWFSYIENKNIYFDISTKTENDRLTARNKGRLDFKTAHKNRHGLNIIQGEWSDNELDYFLNVLNATYYGDYIDGKCFRNLL